MNNDVAIIGASVNIGGIETLPEFFSFLEKDKTTCIEFPKNRFFDISKNFDHQDIAKGSYLKQIDLFDYEFFALDKDEGEKMYPGNRLLLEAAVKTVMNAGYSNKDMENKRVATFVVQQESEYHSLFRKINRNSSESSYLPMAGTRIASFFKWKGPVMSIDTACSSSLSALYYACQSLRNNDCDAAFIGGEVIDFVLKKTVEEHPIYSKTFNCAPYDKNADGTVFGEGVIGILVKPFDRAVEDNDPIYAIIKGGALNRGEMAAKNISVPKADSQAEVIKLACENASISPGDIEFIEGQGTGTIVGDTIELEGIAKIRNNHSCYKNLSISSAKAQFGHLGVLSGLLGLLRTIYALQSRQLLGQYNYQSAYSNFSEEKNNKISITRENKTWEGDRLLAGLSSFGMTGTNAHIIIENYSMPEVKTKSEMMYLFTITGKDKQKVAAVKRYILQYVVNNNDVCLHSLSYSLNRLSSNAGYSELYAFKTHKELVRQMKQQETFDKRYDVVLMFLITEIYDLRHSLEFIEGSTYFKDYNSVVDKNHSITDNQKAIVAQYFSFKLITVMSCSKFKFIGGSFGRYVTKLLSGEIQPEDLITAEKLSKKKAFDEKRFLKYLLSLPSEKNYTVLTKKEDISSISAGIYGYSNLELYQFDPEDNPYIKALKTLINCGVHLNLKKYFGEAVFLQDLFLPVFDKKRCWPK
ncbi:polyketide synthase [Aquimarina agarivorans]|uniref:polyketide synthase n=1 Tax=Aquimarina agarivorans TaxID=980584 RepID=UPI000248FC68|nr:polyketide synthase [Aquimarina agarivorans]